MLLGSGRRPEHRNKVYPSIDPSSRPNPKATNTQRSIAVQPASQPTQVHTDPAGVRLWPMPSSLLMSERVVVAEPAARDTSVS